MTAYLIEHPPVQRQFRERGTTPSGLIVVHTAENAPDWVGPDTGAEGVARFIQGRGDYGSYHVVCDSDSILPLVPFRLQAYGDGTGSNPFAIHVSAATQAARWAAAPAAWRRETVINMGVAAARAARWLDAKHGVKVPAKRISRADSEARKPGFIAHAARDPERRLDPGKDFPWTLMFEAFTEHLNPEPLTPNITAALSSENREELEAALRKVVRRGDDDAAAAASSWLRGLTVRDRSVARITEARRALRRLEVT